jgi:hypothetical protein
MTRPTRLKRATGTRNLADVIRTFGRSPSDAAKQRDVDAVMHGAGRTVSCALRGSVAPYPRRFKHGTLDITDTGAVWHPYWWSARSRTIVVDEHVLTAQPRPRNLGTDWNIKSGGVHSSDGLMPATGFTVLTCSTEGGWFEVAVPTPDVILVTAYLPRPEADLQLTYECAPIPTAGLSQQSPVYAGGRHEASPEAMDGRWTSCTARWWWVRGSVGFNIRGLSAWTCRSPNKLLVWHHLND